MTPKTDIKVFEGNQIRTVWDADDGKYYFSVVDVVQVLTDSANATDYFKKIRKREPELAEFVGTNCPHVDMLSETGKRRRTLAGDADAISYIIQYIPSKKVETFRQWLSNFEQSDSTVTGEIVMYQPDETIKLEVRMDNETVWLTQQQMSELFDKDRSVIGRHIRNIYDEHELEADSTCAKFAHVVSRSGQLYESTAYNLDVIISVGYRVKSVRGTKFRQWANKILKSYLLKGYAADNRYLSLEKKVTEQGKQISELQNKVDFFVRTSLPPVEGIFCDGHIFDAYVQIANLIKQAKKDICLIDNYVDETVLAMLSQRAAGVSATIYTKEISKSLQLAINLHNAQYPPITVNECKNFHDRFLIIDDTVYHFGASLKDAGKKLFAYIKMQETPASVIMGMVR